MCVVGIVVGRIVEGTGSRRRVQEIPPPLRKKMRGGGILFVRGYFLE